MEITDVLTHNGTTWVLSIDGEQYRLGTDDIAFAIPRANSLMDHLLKIQAEKMAIARKMSHYMDLTVSMMENAAGQA